MYALLRKLGISKNILYNKLALFPNQLNFVSEKEMTEFLNTSGARILKVERDAWAGEGTPSSTYYCTK